MAARGCPNGGSASAHRHRLGAWPALDHTAGPLKAGPVSARLHPIATAWANGCPRLGAIWPDAMPSVTKIPTAMAIIRTNSGKDIDEHESFPVHVLDPDG